MTENLQILTNIWVQLIFLSLGMIFFLLEIYKNWKGLGFLISILSFSIFFYGNHLEGQFSFFYLTLFVIGLLLIVLEIFIPGFGFPGISGGILFALALNGLSSNWQEAMVLFLGSGLSSIIMILQLFKGGIQNSRLEEIVLNEKIDKKRDDRYALLGKRGTTVTSLRPTGKAKFGEEMVDVITEGDYIDKDQWIVVYKIDGFRVIVRKERDEE